MTSLKGLSHMCFVKMLQSFRKMFGQKIYEQLLLSFRNHIRTTVSDASKFSVYIFYIFDLMSNLKDLD